MVKRRSRNLKMTVEQRLTYNAGSWRLACHVSDPYDTFPSHLWLTGRINASESRFYSLTHQLRCSLLLPIFVHSELFAYRQKKERERYIPSSTVHYPRHLHPNLHGPCKLIREHPSLYSSYFLCFISCLMVVVLLRCCLLQMAFLSDEVRGWNKLRWDEMGTWSGRWWPHIRWCLHPAPLRSSPIFYYYATKSMCMSFIFRPSSSVIKLLKLRIRR